MKAIDFRFKYYFSSLFICLNTEKFCLIKKLNNCIYFFLLANSKYVDIFYKEKFNDLFICYIIIAEKYSFLTCKQNNKIQYFIVKIICYMKNVF